MLHVLCFVFYMYLLFEFYNMIFYKVLFAVYSTFSKRKREKRNKNVKHGSSCSCKLLMNKSENCFVISHFKGKEDKGSSSKLVE